ncbi:MAG: hypothetical protein VYB14_03930, partial [Planctomycetota bacterium]|nr:hypothetical protein [Planctomycetota bacterium]
VSPAGHQLTTTTGGSVEAGTGTTMLQPAIPLGGVFCAGAGQDVTRWDGGPGGIDRTAWNGGPPRGTGVRQACTTSRSHRLRHHLLNNAGTP